MTVQAPRLRSWYLLAGNAHLYFLGERFDRIQADATLEQTLAVSNHHLTGHNDRSRNVSDGAIAMAVLPAQAAPHSAPPNTQPTAP
jgi:hypothetical protein